MRCLIRTCPPRVRDARELAGLLPNAELIEDTDEPIVGEAPGYRTFIEALKAQGTDDVWHFEDDIELTANWESKAKMLELVAGKTVLIQAFDGYGLGPGGARAPHTVDPATLPWVRGGLFLGGQCFRLPGTMAPELLAFTQHWHGRRKKSHHYCDYAVRAWMMQAGRGFYLANPALVQHRTDLKSASHAARPSTSPTFVR